MGIPGRHMAVRICGGHRDARTSAQRGRLCLRGIIFWWNTVVVITAWGFTRFMDIYQRSTLRWRPGGAGRAGKKWERRGESRTAPAWGLTVERAR